MLQRFIVQAIETKYLGPANVRGSRVKATAAAGSITLEWDDRLNSDENHRVAAVALADKFDWKGTLVQGVLASGNHVHVFSDGE